MKVERREKEGSEYKKNEKLSGMCKEEGNGKDGRKK